jgi:plastocyanin
MRSILAVVTVVTVMCLSFLAAYAQPEGKAQPKHYAVRMITENSVHKFDPETIEVKVGDTISWLNASTAPHTATADDAQQGWLSTGTIAAQRFSKQITPPAAGKFAYHCEFHDMHGTVIVTE